MKCENVKLKVLWYEEDFKVQWIRVSSFRHSMKNKQLLYELSGSKMKDVKWIMDVKQAGSKFQGVGPVER